MKIICLLAIIWIITCGMDCCGDCMDMDYGCWQDSIDLYVRGPDSADSLRVMLYVEDSLFFDENASEFYADHHYISKDFFDTIVLNKEILLRVGVYCNDKWVWSDSLKYRTKANVINDIGVFPPDNGKLPARENVAFSGTAIETCPELRYFMFSRWSRKPRYEHCEASDY